MFLKYGKIIRYFISGSTAALVNIAVLFICVEYLHIWYIAGTCIAFVFGLTTSYTLQKFWTFKDNSREDMHMQFLWFTAFAIIMLGLNAFLMYVLVDRAHLWYILAQAISIALIAFLNFTFFNRVLFNQSKQNATF